MENTVEQHKKVKLEIERTLTHSESPNNNYVRRLRKAISQARMCLQDSVGIRVEVVLCRMGRSFGQEPSGFSSRMIWTSSQDSTQLMISSPCSRASMPLGR